jgi:hypothetical protein
MNKEKLDFKFDNKKENNDWQERIKKYYIKMVIIIILAIINIYNLYLPIGLTNSYEKFIAYLTWIMPFSLVQLIISLVFLIKKYPQKSLYVIVIFLSLLVMIEQV